MVVRLPLVQPEERREGGLNKAGAIGARCPADFEKDFATVTELFRAIGMEALYHGAKFANVRMGMAIPLRANFAALDLVIVVRVHTVIDMLLAQMEIRAIPVGEPDIKSMLGKKARLG